MKRLEVYYIFLLFFFTGFGLTFAQSGIIVSGGSSSGSSGGFSYSVGQLSYQKGTGSGGSVFHGNQHAFEVFEGQSAGLSELQIELSVFPNPVGEKLQIDFNGSVPENSIFRITNAEGKIVLEQPLEQQNTTLNLSGFQKGMYILLITDRKGEWMTSFKLVKTL